MKNIILVSIIMSILWFGCDVDNEKELSSYTINAEITGIEDGTPIYMQLVEEGKLSNIDTADILESKAVFTGRLANPEMIYLRVGDSRKMINLYGENSDISVRVNIDSLDQAEVTGSSVHDDLMAFKKYMKLFDEQSAKLNQEYKMANARSDTDRSNEILIEYEDLRKEQVNAIKKFVKDRSQSYISPFIIQRYLAYDMDYPELKELLLGLDSAVHDSEDFQSLSERMETLETVAIGKPAVDFALNDTTGNPIAISSFRGKFLLIDFWASWCGPCRKENPNVVKLYNDYNDKGFEIIGVSFDDSRERWVDAIQNDGLTWPHVSDLKGWSSKAGKLYAINSIPATVLLDRNGTIVAKNLRGEELRKKLEELYAAEEQNS